MRFRVRTVYNDPNNPNRNILSYANFANNDALELNLLPLKFTKWWAVNASSDVYFKPLKEPYKMQTQTH